MATWNSRGLRGSLLEEMINFTIEEYREKGLALIQKIPTPITPVEIEPESRHITLAYFDKQSTVDYIGAVQGIPVCFDAKECQTDTFPLANIHEHQMEFMNEMEAQEGISFIIVYYTKRNEAFYVPYKKLVEFFDRMQKNGRKSFTIQELDAEYKIEIKNSARLKILEVIQRDLESR